MREWSAKGQMPNPNQLISRFSFFSLAFLFSPCRLLSRQKSHTHTHTHIYHCIVYMRKGKGVIIGDANIVYSARLPVWDYSQWPHSRFTSIRTLFRFHLPRCCCSCCCSASSHFSSSVCSPDRTILIKLKFIINRNRQLHTHTHAHTERLTPKIHALLLGSSIDQCARRDSLFAADVATAVVAYMRDIDATGRSIHIGGNMPYIRMAPLVPSSGGKEHSEGERERHCCVAKP